ncbi:ABC transporter substrate-binding protein [Ramlibacter albus]|uniref:Extracellular solute-binding protein n=1 Tax=Ramlibacter albus TaxID=2079448 RepID=A0A923MEB6_9BURK|nr:extracellular solute-binding protein [Ramlibacter albus]MBC5767923.1 extracellular solute-binding protein [Ramlibacter albus]
MKKLFAGWVIALVGAAHAQMAPWEKQLYDAAKNEKPITVYTAHYNTDEAQALCGAFEKKYAGLKCNFVRTTAQVAFQRFQQDIAANAPVASIFSSTDVGHYGELKKKGLLMPYTPHNAANMVDSLKAYNDKDGQYWVTAAALMLLTYNTAEVKESEAPKNWPDLLDPKWKGKVSIGHPAYSGYVGTWVVLMNKLYGWDYFKKLEKNQPQIGRSVNDTVTMLNSKERVVAAGPEATTLLSKDKGNPLAVVYPTDGALLMVSPSGIPKNAPSPNAAKLYMEFLLSKEAGAVQVQSHSLAVMKGVPPAPGAKALEQIKVVRPTEDEIIKGIPEVKEKFRDTFGV